MKSYLLTLLIIFLCVLRAEGVAATFYVSPSSPSPTPPYSSWSTAATNIQDAVNAASPGDLVLVTNGVYKPANTVFLDRSNLLFGPSGYQFPCRIAIRTNLTVSSVNGPGVTMIYGPETCVALADKASLSGFTLTSGTVFANVGFGAGAYCQTTNALITNCIICGNTNNSIGRIGGGGVYQGILNDCLLYSNATTALGGGAYGTILNNCVISNNTATGSLGGGAYNCWMNNCTLTGNSVNGGNQSVAGEGAAAFGGVLNNCLIFSNFCNSHGNGAAGCSNIMCNCLIVGNQSGPGGTDAAFGSALTNCTICYNGTNVVGESSVVQYSTFRNCILYSNSADFQYSSDNLQNCCIWPAAIEGPFDYTNNFTNAPLFVSSKDFHLQSNSPCINAGKNIYVSVIYDLDGNPRITGGTVDMGAYEYQSPQSVISYQWLQQYGLPTDGSADYADTDGDDLNNWQEWVAGTNPTNAASALTMLVPVATNNPPGLLVSWQSVATRTYYLQSSTNLSARPAFTTIQSNLAGLAGTTSFTDITATNGGSYFYRVVVQ